MLHLTSKWSVLYASAVRRFARRLIWQDEDRPVGQSRSRTGSDAVSAPVVVVNQAFVTQILGGGTAVGRRIRYLAAAERWYPAVDNTTTTYEIVGVISDLQINTVDPAQVHPVVYHPAADTGSALLIRVRGAEPASLTPRLRDLTAALDPSTRLNVVSFSEMKRQASLALRLVVLAVTLIVASVLMLSAAGLYALMSFTVSQRRKEIGIRAAMGGYGATLLPVMSVLMLLVGLSAALGPARRSLRILPTEALRAD